MFGYVTANKPEMKIREFARYRGFYCGLCRQLRKRHGCLGQLTLTYDMTFLILLLSSLYEPATRETRRRCLAHPAKRQFVLTNEISNYAADMNILLAHDNFRDDWEDERKVSGLLGMKAFERKRGRAAQRYPRQAEAVTRALSELGERERERCRDIDAVARPFGSLMAELFVWKEDPFQDILRQMGFYLGKFIYILDAYMDMEEDRKKKCYNPFVEECGDWGGTGPGTAPAREHFDERVRGMLSGTLCMAIAEFEKLPCEQDVAILRNILYEGVWTKYERKRKHDE